MAADPHRHFMSVEEYLELERHSLDARYEYIDGVVTMLAGGTANHSRISVSVVSLLQAALRGSPCEVFHSDLRVSISSTRYVLPDASISCEPSDLQGENDIIYSPRVIVEVLSPSTEAADRGKKFRYYQRCPSIQEYILNDGTPPDRYYAFEMRLQAMALHSANRNSAQIVLLIFQGRFQ